MKLTPPKKFTFIVAVFIFAIGVVVSFLNIANAGLYGLGVVAIAFLLLALGNLVKGL